MVKSSELDVGRSNTFQLMEQGTSRTVSVLCREGDDTLRDQASKLNLFGSTKLAVSSTKALNIYGVPCSYYKGRQQVSSSAHQFSSMCRF